MGFLSHAFLAAVFSLSPFLASAAALKPNIILIYADDLGMGMLGCYGQERPAGKTPGHLQKGSGQPQKRPVKTGTGPAHPFFRRAFLQVET